ncbi:MAG: hypothetical protein N2423_01785, partial [Novosphingobium sp.]|nr:hypothetical protein [Novosphingobium sp.]
DAYPFFDAPAMTAEEYCSAHGIEIVPLPDAAAQFQAKFDEDETEDAIGMASLESLIGLGTGKREKKPVLAIDPTEADTAQSLEAQLPDFAKYTGRNHIPTDLSPSDILPSALPADFGRLPCETLPEATQLHMPPAGPSAGESKLPIGFAHKDEAIHHQEDSRHLVMQRGSRASGHPAATGNQQEAEAPLDLLQFDCLEGPNSGNPAAACGLTIHEEAGDKLPWPTGAPGATEPRQTLVQKPARHAIRVIAASVQSGNGTHKPPTTLRGAELILRLAHAMITLLTSMKRWSARR